MDEVTGPVIAIALVLCAVFVPTAFMAGISGQFFKQFALTIAASTIICAFNSLTLSPPLPRCCSKPHGHGEHGHVQQEALPRAGIAIIGGLVAYFFLLAPIGHLVGIEVGGHGHGAAEAAAHTSAAALVGIAGRRVRRRSRSSGWFAGIVGQSACWAAFFRGVQLVLRRHDQRLRPDGRRLAAHQLRSRCWSMAA